VNRSSWRSLMMGLVLCLAGVSARADVVAVVSSKSAITRLSRAEVADIFLGKASRFPDGTAVAPLDQAEGSAVRVEFYQKVVGQTAAQMRGYWSKIIFTGRGEPPPTLADSEELKKRLQENPAAIGYIERSQVDETVRVVF
jgi:ABC-type phosphate transport system substrate-binding protein